MSKLHWSRPKQRKAALSWQRVMTPPRSALAKVDRSTVLAAAVRGLGDRDSVIPGPDQLCAWDLKQIAATKP
jgi:hypothetical protein